MRSADSVAAGGSEPMYQVGFWITWVIAFLAGYIYAINEYGFFLGASLGWIPAAILAALCGALWPLIVLVLIALFVIAAS